MKLFSILMVSMGIAGGFFLYKTFESLEGLDLEATFFKMLQMISIIICISTICLGVLDCCVVSSKKPIYSKFVFLLLINSINC